MRLSPLLSCFRFKVIEKSSHYRFGACGCQSAQWLLCLHQLHVGNFHGVWLESFAEHVCDRRCCYSSCWLHSVNICNWQHVTKASFYFDVIWNDGRTVSIWSPRLLVDLLQPVRLHLGAYCESFLRDFRSLNRIIAANFRTAFRDSSTESEQPHQMFTLN